MGFDDGGIVLDREDETYYVGQFVRGRLEFELSNVKQFRGIYIDFKGYCKVHWTTSHSRRENDKTVHYTVSHDSYEEYINVTTYLVGSKSGEHQLFAGKHVFPFEFQIPLHCPSSFEGPDGHVRYELKVTVDRAFKLDQHKTAFFRVLAPIDLNQNPYCKEAIGMEFYQSYCCWCMSIGKSEVTVKVPAGGACPGQIVPIELCCKNNSTVELLVTFQLKEKKQFHATVGAGSADTRKYEEAILELKKGPIPGHTERNWVVEFQIPEMEVANLMGCRFIDVDYKLKVKIETPTCHEDDSDERPFIIGSIPLQEFSAPITATEGVPVSHAISQYPPVMNQPIAGNSPYPYPAPGVGINPPQNPPYPASPFPNANPPYPNANPPYPNANPPYPNANPPYPNANPPYPNANPPYPNANPPYPNSNSPFPSQGTSPCPKESNAPYPPATSPYPPVTSPYPPSTVPYGSSPKPEFTGTTLLKTGNLGFVAQGTFNDKDGAKMPLLPPLAGIPPYPSSPYATASAPEPSTPNDEGKKLSEDIRTNSSPFNPDFKG